MSNDKELMEWKDQIFAARNDSGIAEPEFRRDLILEEFDKTGNVVKQWEIYNAWICDWEAGDFDASGNEVHIETATICHEGFKEIQ
jgi:phage tail-like protein